MCKWILDFLLDRTQMVKVNTQLSEPLILSTGLLQGCLLCPLLFTLFTDDFRFNGNSTLIFKFSDGISIEGLITNADESACRVEVKQLVDRCANDHLELNVVKTKEVIIIFRKDGSNNNSSNQGTTYENC